MRRTLLLKTPTNKEMLLKFDFEGALRDPYGQSWSMECDPTVLDIHIGEYHRMRFGTYPE